MGVEKEYTTTIVNALINWLEIELPLSEGSWNTSYPEGLPKQRNGYDCGVFLLLYAHHLAFDEEKTFGPIDQDTLDRSREIIACDILRGRFFDYVDEGETACGESVEGNSEESVKHQDGEKPPYRRVLITNNQKHSTETAPHKPAFSNAPNGYRKVEINGHIPEHPKMPISNRVVTLSTGENHNLKSKNAPPVGKISNNDIPALPY